MKSFRSLFVCSLAGANCTHALFIPPATMMLSTTSARGGIASRQMPIQRASSTSVETVPSTHQQSANQDETGNRKPKSRIPEDFGVIPGGTAIDNKDEIFDEIDKALGVSKPPDFEVILTDHLAYTKNPISQFLHLSVMRFGHIAIRYTTSDGTSRIMNILGNFEDENAQMVNFFEPSEYFFGTDEKISQQWGVYNRPFVGVRIENVAKGATDALHSYFEALAKASEIGGVDGSDQVSGEVGRMGDAPGSSNRGAVRFQLVEVNLSRIAREVPAPFDRFFFNIADWIRGIDDKRKETLSSSSTGSQASSNASNKSSGGEIRDRVMQGVMDARQAVYHAGNCAQWTSGGLDFVGLIRKPRLFPKAILIDILEDEYLNNNRPNNVNVVYYNEVKHAPQHDPYYKCLKSALVSPIKPVRNAFYDNMEDFASAVVTVPEGSTKAVVETRSKPRKSPQVWLQLVTASTTYVPAAVLLGLVDHVGPIGPTAAAGWLFLNWWLH